MANTIYITQVLLKTQQNQWEYTFTLVYKINTAKLKSFPFRSFNNNDSNNNITKNRRTISKRFKTNVKAE